MLAQFIAVNMARALPMSLFFLLGVFLTQAGLKLLQPHLRVYPFILFMCYWIFLSIGAFSGIGPTKDLDWIEVLGIFSPVIGVPFYIVSFIWSKMRKKFYEVRKDESI